jgi:hypothetical protein
MRLKQSNSMLVCFGAGLLHKQKICPRAGSPKEHFEKIEGLNFKNDIQTKTPPCNGTAKIFSKNKNL